MEKYDEVFIGSTRELKQIIKSFDVPLKAWMDWGIKPSKYVGRLIEVRITNQVDKVFSELEEYYSFQKQLTVSDNIRQAKVFYCEDQNLMPRYYFEVVGSAEKSLAIVKREIGETRIGDVVVVVDKYQPINLDGGYGKKKLKITVAGYGIRDPYY